jgi:hypothetical protein
LSLNICVLDRVVVGALDLHVDACSPKDESHLVRAPPEFGLGVWVVTEVGIDASLQERARENERVLVGFCSLRLCDAHNAACNRGARDRIDQHEAAGFRRIREGIDRRRPAESDFTERNVVRGARVGRVRLERIEIEQRADLQARHWGQICCGAQKDKSRADHRASR